MKNLNLKEKPKEYTRIKQLVFEGKHDEAWESIDKFKETGELTPFDILIYNLLKCDMLLQQGLFEDDIKFAEQIYQKSLGLGKNLLSVDALLKMAHGLIMINDLNKSDEIIKQGENLLRDRTYESAIEFKQRDADLFFVKGLFYTLIRNDVNKALMHFEHSIELYEDLDAKQEVIKPLLLKAWALSTKKGEMDIALKLLEQCLAVCEENNHKYLTALCLFFLAVIYSFKGELNRSINLYKQILPTFKELNNKYWIASIFNNLSGLYLRKGDLDKAIEYIEQSLALNNEMGKLKAMANGYDFLIQILIKKGDVDQARKYFYQFEKLRNQLKDNDINLLYLLNKALILKINPRVHNLGMAEEILKQILDENVDNYELKVTVLLNLCELLLTELQMTNNLEIVDELESYIAQLLNIAEKSLSYILLTEIYFLKGKLALLKFNMRKARRFLTQAQQIAARWGYKQLTAKISIELNNLRKQTNMWEELKGTNISLAERIKLAGLDRQMDQLLRNRLTLTSQITEEKVTIHKARKICVVCKGDILGFMYTCSCDTIYCDNCARALIDLENVCWVCNAPIDSSKPSKSYKKEKLKKKDIIKEVLEK